MNIFDTIAKLFSTNKPHNRPTAINVETAAIEDSPQTIAKPVLDSTTDQLLLNSYSDSENGRAVARIADLKQLKKLHIELRSSTKKLFEQLSSFSELEILGLSGSACDQDLSKVACLPNLNSLSLQHTLVTGSGLRFLQQLDGLRTLSIRATTFSAEGITELSKLKQLETLSLWIVNEFQPVDLQCLAKLTGLKHLDLTVSNDCSKLRFLSELGQLESLSLNRHSGPLSVYEDVLAKLGQTQLKKLSLQYVKLSPQAWTNVCNISSLTHLSILYLEICEDQNQTERRLHLADLQQLERLTNLEDLKATDRRSLGQQSLFLLIDSLSQLDELANVKINLW